MKLLDNEQPFPQTDEGAIDYLPDKEAAHGLYRVLRAQGKTIEDALMEVFQACLPLEMQTHKGERE